MINGAARLARNMAGYMWENEQGKNKTTERGEETSHPSGIVCEGKSIVTDAKHRTQLARRASFLLFLLFLF